MQFADLSLHPSILRAIEAKGYATATPIQAKTIPHTLDGQDVLGCAQTGTGKTAAFALPILHRLQNTPRPTGQAKRPRCLVLCPTRELAGQISDSFAAYGKYLDLYHAVVYGGVNQNPQVRQLQRGVDILIATPGRLMDLGSQGHVDLSAIQTLVLDEADRMLDMGFINDIKRIVAKTPDDRQTLLFSATMPPAIRRLADNLLRNPVSIQTAPQSTTAPRVEQAVYFVDKKHKTTLLSHLLGKLSINRAIVFTRTKHGADKVVRQLYRDGIQSTAIHGNKTQNQRQRSLDAFRQGKVSILVATDIAARGIDVDGVSHVFNYDLSNEPESYVHRIGRTARAGAQGIAIAFCDAEERPHLAAIQRLIKADIPVLTDHPDTVPPGSYPRATGGGGGGGGGRTGNSSGNSRGGSKARRGGPPRSRSQFGDNRGGGASKSGGATKPRRRNNRSRG